MKSGSDYAKIHCFPEDQFPRQRQSKFYTSVIYSSFCHLYLCKKELWSLPRTQLKGNNIRRVWERPPPPLSSKLLQPGIQYYCKCPNVGHCNFVVLYKSEKILHQKSSWTSFCLIFCLRHFWLRTLIHWKNVNCAYAQNSSWNYARYMFIAKLESWSTISWNKLDLKKTKNFDLIYKSWKNHHLSYLHQFTLT